MNAVTKKSFAITGTKAELAELINLQYVARLLPALSSANIKSSQHGGHISRLKGRGIEFDEVRIYQAGDDIRRMDWKITAKTGKPHTKLFHDERDRPVYFLIDDRINMHFGTRNCFKSVVAAQIASIFAWLMTIHGDKVGAIIADGYDNIELKPYMRKMGVLPLLKYLADDTRLHKDGKLVDSLLQLRHVINPGSLIIIISDFRNIGEDFEKNLSRLKLHNEVLSFFVYDEFEKDLPKAGGFQVSNGKYFSRVNASSAKIRREYRQIFENRYNAIADIFKKWNIPMIEIGTHEIVSDILRDTLVRKSRT